MGNDPDMLLLRRIAAGEEAALETLYQRHGRQLLAVLNVLLDDSAAAEDALQLVMMTVWRKASGFRGESAVSTWLHAIARRQASSMNRRTPISIPIPDEDVFAADAPDDPDSGHAALHAAMRRLPDIERCALDLIYVQELTLAETAERLGVPVNTVKSRLARARQSLRRWFRHEEADYVR